MKLPNEFDNVSLKLSENSKILLKNGATKTVPKRNGTPKYSRLMFTHDEDLN